MKKALFIDRDGTIIVEPPTDYQVDSLAKLEFLPYAITQLAELSTLGYELVMVSNQDGRGTSSFPEDDFLEPHNKMLTTLSNEGVVFDDILIDNSFAEDNSPMRKPRTGMLTKYMNGDYDLANSYVIGDRLSDVELAKNLGAKAILLSSEQVAAELFASNPELKAYTYLVSNDWREVYEFIRLGKRTAKVKRCTKETNISLYLDLDGKGESRISTPVNFLNHMLWQIVHHAGVTLVIDAEGDTEVDCHHTVEDIALVLGAALKEALGDKNGIERYGFTLPMDESDATVRLDLGGRIDFIWQVNFSCETLGDMATEMFKHFFKSLAEAGLFNLHIQAEGENNHHLIEGVFKAFARALRCALKRDAKSNKLPTSKGVI